MMIPTFFAVSQVLYVVVGGWNNPLDAEINRKIQSLDDSIDHENQMLHQDIKFISDHKAFVIYEIAEKHPSPS